MPSKPSDSIPDVEFSKLRSTHGFDLVRINELEKRNGSLLVPVDRPHRVHFAHIFLIRDGQGTHLIDFDLLEVRGPCLMIVPASWVHAFSFPSAFRATVLLMSKEALSMVLRDALNGYLRGLFEPSLTPHLLPLSRDELGDFEDLFAQIEAELRRPEAPDSIQIVHSLTQLLLLRMNRLRQRLGAPPLRGLSGYMSVYLSFLYELEHPAQRSRNAQYFAERLGISYKHLNTICRQFTGETAKQFIDRRLIIESKRYLVSTDMTAAEIAIVQGFEEPTNFGKFFKKHTGTTPKQFRISQAARHLVQDLP